MFIPHYMSCVMCHVSCVTCQLSRVTCHMYFFSSVKKMGPSGGASWWKVCYQRGLTRLVYIVDTICGIFVKTSWTEIWLLCTIFNRPGVAGAVLQTASSFIDSLSYSFPHNLQNSINPKLLELGRWHFERMLTPILYHMSGVTCHV